MARLNGLTTCPRLPTADALQGSCARNAPGYGSNREVRLLLIDADDQISSAHVRRAFPPPRHEIMSTTTGAAGIDRVRASPPDVVLLELRLPGESAIEIYEKIRAFDARIPVIFMSSSTSADAAIEVMKRGAFDYLRKPIDVEELQRTVADALAAERSSAMTTIDRPEDTIGEDTFIGRSKAMLEAWKAIGRVSAQEVSVLITGESGTGKEVAARAIYEHSARASAPFLALNCAAIPENLLESELFGHERGSFTGADRRSVGKFEQCHGGTILLDEIGDMPLSLQAKILRLLQEQEFQRVGGSETIRTNVRVIASTHRDLRALVAERKFRADLFYRLAVCTIELPPLRERADDLPILANHFVTRYSRALGRDVREIAPEAMAQLSAYAWPGNIRELQSVLKQGLLRATGTVLLPAFLPALESGECSSESSSESLDVDGFILRQLRPDTNDLYETTHREVDRVLLTRVFDYTNGNQRHAARVLGVARQTLREKLRGLSLRVTRSVTETTDSLGGVREREDVGRGVEAQAWPVTEAKYD